MYWKQADSIKVVSDGVIILEKLFIYYNYNQIDLFALSASNRFSFCALTIFKNMK